MSRIRLQLPRDFPFSCEIPVRITDLNYGGHAGNDTILTLLHEARMQFLQSLGYTEMNMEGMGMIMADAAIEFRSELFYPEKIRVFVAATTLTRIGFDLYYKMEREKPEAGRPTLIAQAKTTMICFDYDRKKIVGLPDPAARKLSS